MKKSIWILAVFLVFIAATASRTNDRSVPTDPVLQIPTDIPTSATKTQLTTQPTVPTTIPQATAAPTDSGEEGLLPMVAAFHRMARSSWTSPLNTEYGEITGSRRFASSRSSGKRAHAGVDFVAPHGTPVYAITSGTVQRVAAFYYNTMAVEIQNADGSVLRYCEIDPSVKEGDIVIQGQKIGTILRADTGTEMLHLEVYTGEATGKLTQSENREYAYVDSQLVFQRRWDLLDPTFLTELPCWDEEV